MWLEVEGVREDDINNKLLYIAQKAQLVLCDDRRGGTKGGPSRRVYIYISDTLQILIYISDALHCAAEKLTQCGKSVILQVKK